MASKKEWKELIALSGKLNSSLQRALTEAAERTRKLTGAVSLTWQAAVRAKTALAGMATQASAGVARLSAKLPAGVTALGELGNKNALVKASFTGLKLAGQGALSAIKAGAKLAGAGLAKLAAAGIKGLGAMAKTGLETASKLTEVQKVVDATYGGGAGRINRWSRELLSSHGLAELSAKEYSATMGALLKGAGVSGDEMMVMSQNLTMLTGDMASFYHLQPDEMFTKIRGAISGETESLKQLGIHMSAANLEAYALSQGIGASYSSMSQGQQMVLRYNYLLQQTAAAQGDFSRTSGSFANQQKLLKENFTQLAAKIMTGVMPAAAKLMEGMNQAITSMDSEALGGFVAQLTDLAVQLVPIAMELLPVIQSLLMTILPPLLEIIRVVLPPLTKFLTLVISVIGKIIGVGQQILGSVAGLFAGGAADAAATPGGELAGFARGGFSSRPAIFGEAGLEAAIPIRRGNPRSLALLQRTAELLGVAVRGRDTAPAPSPAGRNTPERVPVLLRFGPVAAGGEDLLRRAAALLRAGAREERPGATGGKDLLRRTGELPGLRLGGGIRLTYAPVIYGGDSEGLQPVLRRSAREMLAWAREEENKRRRLDFGLAPVPV